MNTASTPQAVYQAIMIGDNAFGHAISLPVELRDGGVLDFGFSLSSRIRKGRAEFGLAA